MLELDYSPELDKDEAFQALLAKTASYTPRLREVIASGNYEANESSIALPTNDGMLAAVQQVAAAVHSQALRYHVVVGIGGSNLGTKAIYDALYGYEDVMNSDRWPKILFAETTNPEWLRSFTRLAAQLNAPEEVLVSIISKSGGTTETLANFEIVVAALKARFGDVAAILPRVVAITDQGSALWDQAGQLGVQRLVLQEKVGGRYSVLSAVGLFPLLTVGVDIAALRRGAQAVRDSYLTEGADNLAATSAAILAYYHAKTAVINDNFFFSAQLESLGKWYRQLMGESIGKAQSLDGADVHAGITPTVSLGSTDLHSVGQLYLGGPKDKITTFVYVKATDDIAVPNQTDRIIPALVPMISDRKASDIIQAIYQGTKIAYDKASLPNMTVSLDRIDAQSLGAYLQFKMMEMMYLGQLLNVNSFDQPGVELYKVETKRILQGE